ncbi:MAG: helix-turn-helix domain-containing protein [Acidobacteriia bacterium]|nr:helix-turn-helix domain-containing protein [Terriglobia bacterium]
MFYKLLTRPEAARKLGLSLPCFDKAVALGQIPGVTRIGARLRFPEKELIQLIEHGAKSLEAR